MWKHHHVEWRTISLPGMCRLWSVSHMCHKDRVCECERTQSNTHTRDPCPTTSHQNMAIGTCDYTTISISGTLSMHLKKAIQKLQDYWKNMEGLKGQYLIIQTHLFCLHLQSIHHLILTYSHRAFHPNKHPFAPIPHNILHSTYTPFYSTPSGSSCSASDNREGWIPPDKNEGPGMGREKEREKERGGERHMHRKDECPSSTALSSSWTDKQGLPNIQILRKPVVVIPFTRLHFNLPLLNRCTLQGKYKWYTVLQNRILSQRLSTVAFSWKFCTKSKQ